MDFAIEAQGVGKRYARRGEGGASLHDRLLQIFRPGRTPAREPFWAVRDIHLKIPKGATVGFVGPNGSGKSSMLGLIAGTITPTEGTIRTSGRISSLLELGAGFHPNLTGRENIFLNASILGIPKGVIAGKLQRIIDFSGLAEFIDMPVKHYSSGMYVRLGFSVAVEVDPDILLVDEVLAVGDISFQNKCLDRVRDFQRRGRTLVLVTHDLGIVEQFCHDVKLIYQGRLLAEGDPSEVILAYMRKYMMRIGDLNVEEHGTRDLEFTRVTLRNAEGQEASSFIAGQSMRVELDYRAKRRIEQPVFGFGVKTAGGLHVFGTNTQLARYDVPSVEGEGRIDFTIDPLPLLHGKYLMSLAAHSADHRVHFHRIEDSIPFSVENTTGEHGIFRLPCTWHHEPQRPA